MAKQARNPGVGRGAGIRIQTERACEQCGGSYWASRSDARFCVACSDLRKFRAYEDRTKGVCTCGGFKTRKSSLCRSCNGKDRATKINRERNPNWRGGETLHRAGYRFVLDPRPNPKHRYVAEHRLLWEQAYGPIPPGHIVHHLNGNKTDNRLENLTTLSNSAHRKLHADVDGERSRYIQRLEARIRELESLVNALPAIPAQGGHPPRKVS